MSDKAINLINHKYTLFDKLLDLLRMMIISDDENLTNQLWDQYLAVSKDFKAHNLLISEKLKDQRDIDEIQTKIKDQKHTQKKADWDMLTTKLIAKWQAQKNSIKLQMHQLGLVGRYGKINQMTQN